MYLRRGLFEVMRILPNIKKLYISLNIVYNLYLIIKYTKVKNIKHKNQTSPMLPSSQTFPNKITNIISASHHHKNYKLQNKINTHGFVSNSKSRKSSSILLFPSSIESFSIFLIIFYKFFLFFINKNSKNLPTFYIVFWNRIIINRIFFYFF